MNHLFFTVMSALLLSGCLNVAGTTKSVNGIREAGLDDGLRPNEMLVNHKYTGLSREGMFPKTGDSYSYKPGGGDVTGRPASGRGIWMTGCSTDQMTDRVNCRTNLKPPAISGGAFAKLDGGLAIAVNTSGSIKSACVFGHDFPGRNAMIRVDSNPALVTDTEGCVAGASATRLQQQLLSGNVLMTRRTEWPYDGGRDQTIKIASGFSQVRELFLFSRIPSTRALFQGD